DRKISHAGVRRSEPDLPSAPCTKGVQGAAISLILRCFPAPHPAPPADAPCTRLALPWGILCPLVSPRGNKKGAVELPPLFINHCRVYTCPLLSLRVPEAEVRVELTSSGLTVRCLAARLLCRTIRNAGRN